MLAAAWAAAAAMDAKSILPLVIRLVTICKHRKCCFNMHAFNLLLQNEIIIPSSWLHHPRDRRLSYKTWYSCSSNRGWVPLELSTLRRISSHTCAWNKTVQLSIKRIAYKITSKLVKIINKDKQQTALLVVKTTVLITALVFKRKGCNFWRTDGDQSPHHMWCCCYTCHRNLSKHTHRQEEAAARMMGRCCRRCYRKWLVSHAVQAAILDFEFSSLCLVTPALRSQIAACFVNYYCRVIVIAASIFSVDKYKSKEEKRKTTHGKCV